MFTPSAAFVTSAKQLVASLRRAQTDAAILREPARKDLFDDARTLFREASVPIGQDGMRSAPLGERRIEYALAYSVQLLGDERHYRGFRAVEFCTSAADGIEGALRAIEPKAARTHKPPKGPKKRNAPPLGEMTGDQWQPGSDEPTEGIIRAARQIDAASGSAMVNTLVNDLVIRCPGLDPEHLEWGQHEHQALLDFEHAKRSGDSRNFAELIERLQRDFPSKDVHAAEFRRGLQQACASLQAILDDPQAQEILTRDVNRRRAIAMGLQPRRPLPPYPAIATAASLFAYLGDLLVWVDLLERQPQTRKPRCRFHSGHDRSQGTWLEPGLGIERIAKILGYKDSRTAKRRFESTGLIQDSRQIWTLRLDGAVSAADREKLQSAARSMRN